MANKVVYFLSGNGIDTWEITVHDKGIVTPIKIFNIETRLKKRFASMSKIDPDTHKRIKNVEYYKAKLTAEKYMNKLRNMSSDGSLFLANYTAKQ